MASVETSVASNFAPPSSSTFAYSKSALKRVATQWPHYSCDWSNNSNSFCSLAVSSYLPTRYNQIQLLKLPSVEHDEFAFAPETLSVEYVATKVMWSPSKVKNSEYLAAAGDGVYIWKVSEEGDASILTGRLVSRQAPRRSSTDDIANNGTKAAQGPTNPPAPITSFDWSKMDPSLLVTASYDTTCTLWCLETGSIKTQLIAHDKEVFDVAFSPISADSFVSVGADGSLRLFDVRTLDHSTIVYESPDARALLRVQWNALDPNYLATFALDSKRVIVMDIRMPSVPAAELGGHREPVMTMRWSPQSSSQIITSDEATLRLWDLHDYEKSPQAKFSLDVASISTVSQANISSMSDPVPVQHIMWPASAPNWIGVSSPDQLAILRL